MALRKICFRNSCHVKIFSESPWNMLLRNKFWVWISFEKSSFYKNFYKIFYKKSYKNLRFWLWRSFKNIQLSKDSLELSFLAKTFITNLALLKTYLRNSRLNILAQKNQNLKSLKINKGLKICLLIYINNINIFKKLRFLRNNSQKIKKKKNCS